MSSVLSDDQIRRLIQTPKTIDPKRLSALLKLRKGRRNRQRTLKFTSDAGHQMEIILRQGSVDPLNFSAILGYRLASGEFFRLKRYNGKHEHQNKIEKEEKFYDFHIHTASERYQKAGWKPDGHARRTSRFSDLEGALRCLLEDCGFKGFARKQQELFEESD